MISRRSCSGGRPKSSARPRHSQRQAASTGSINSQRTSDKSSGYGRRCCVFWSYRPEPECAQAHNTDDGSTAPNRASWNETGTSHLPPHPSPHPANTPHPHQEHHRHHDPTLQESSDTRAFKMKTTSGRRFDVGRRRTSLKEPTRLPSARSRSVSRDSARAIGPDPHLFSALSPRAPTPARPGDLSPSIPVRKVFDPICPTPLPRY